MSFDDKFASLMAKLDKDPEAKLSFQQNPIALLKAADIPLIQTMVMEPESLILETTSVKESLLAMLDSTKLSPEPMAMAMEVSGEDEQTAVAMAMEVSGEDEHFSVNQYWWGFDIVMNEKLTQDIVDGLSALEPISAALAGALAAASLVTAGTAAIIGTALVAVFVAKVTQIKIVDKGKGVHWPITWPQAVALQSAASGASIASGTSFLPQQWNPVTYAAVFGAAITVAHPFRNS